MVFQEISQSGSEEEETSSEETSLDSDQEKAIESMESSSNKPEVHEKLWSPKSPIEKFNQSSDVIEVVSDERIDSPLAKTSSKQSASHHMPKIEKQF